VGGAVVDPYLLQGNGTAQPPSVVAVTQSPASIVRGKNILFATHGFNVNYQAGACALANLEAQLMANGMLRSSDLFIGVLWPGDFWIPAINYPFEGDTAIDCGNRLAKFCNQLAAPAASFSFASHSLGARLMLQAVSALGRKARSVCLTAAAINQDCLQAEYRSAAANISAIYVLSSHEDLVLKLAFPVGDVIGDILDDDHTFFESALGRDGPSPTDVAGIVPPWQIPDDDGYDHGDYLPPGTGPLPDPNPKPLWPAVAKFIGQAFQGIPQSWP
jgi:esterase/lipase superfamily enzyme